VRTKKEAVMWMWLAHNKASGMRGSRAEITLRSRRVGEPCSQAGREVLCYTVPTWYWLHTQP
jgi:hypothetical protein